MWKIYKHLTPERNMTLVEEDKSEYIFRHEPKTYAWYSVEDREKKIVICDTDGTVHPYKDFESAKDKCYQLLERDYPLEQKQ